MSGAGAGPLRRTLVLFEGRSDRLAFEALARRRGVDLDAIAVDLVELDGITNLRTRLTALGGSGARVLGLYDAAEERYVSGVLRDLDVLPGDLGARGLGARDLGAGGLGAVGFFGCVRDLEDEVIRAAGPDLVLETLAARGELARFRVFQRQPAQRVRSIYEQLHRFAGTAAGRKSRFAADVIEVVPLDRMPEPLTRLLDAVVSDPQT